MNAVGWAFLGLTVAYAVWYVWFTLARMRAQRRRYERSLDASVRAVLSFLDTAPAQLQLTPEQATRAALLRNDLEEILGDYLIPVAPSGPITLVSQ